MFGIGPIELTTFLLVVLVLFSTSSIPRLLGPLVRGRFRPGNLDRKHDLKLALAVAIVTVAVVTLLNLPSSAR